jgi:CheY-like chemotaxis protein
MPASVLVVDDQPAMCLMLAEMLAREGYNVQFAWRVEEAQSWVEGGAHFDLVVLDYMMPGITGDKFADWLHQRSDATRILFVTGYAADLSAVHPLQADVEAVLEKPFTRAQLLSAVSQMMPTGIDNRLSR